MSTELIINVAPGQTRVALLEGEVVAEVHHEEEGSSGITSNIYKGRVRRVLPGMQAAFVDIGLERAAFLYVDDVGAAARVLDESEVGGLDAGPPHLAEVDGPPPPPPKPVVPIERQLKAGQEVVVQVAKGPVGAKGARVTTRLTLPGRLLVLMPHADHVGVSRRISDADERLRLREIVEGLRPPGVGFIVRTAAEGAEPEDLRSDIQVLIALWNDLVGKKAAAPVPSALFTDLDLALRCLRDLLTEQLDRVVVDDPHEHERVRRFAQRVMPDLAHRVELYDGQEPIFDAFGVEDELARALSPKVWLRSGGYIVIEQTEALTTVDVNTGRYVGRRNLEETLVKTNLEAVREIAYQLRLRDVGGIIVIDFIDMERVEHRDKVVGALTDALRRDRTRTVVHPMSPLGLVELTRKRTRPSLLSRIAAPCRHCDGRGYVQSVRMVGHKVVREIMRVGRVVRTDSLAVHVHPDVADYLCGEGRPLVERLEASLRKHTVTLPVAAWTLQEYDVIGIDTGFGPSAGSGSPELGEDPDDAVRAG